MKKTKRFIALCASALFFNVVCVDCTQAKERLSLVGLPFINSKSFCIDDSSVVNSLGQYVDTSKNIMCQLYENKDDQIVVTFPLQVDTTHAVFVFKVYQNSCLTFLFQTTVQDHDIPQLYFEENTYKICCD